MRAKFVNEKFTEDSDPIKDLNIGYGKKPLTKSWKILDFIKSKGEEGASLKEIQYFIWTEVQGYSDESFWKRSSDYHEWETGRFRKGQRASRGYWNTNLFGGGYFYRNQSGNHVRKNNGLLGEYCKKNDKGKWVFVKYPKPGENIY